ncbi:MAG TPA: peptidylprolyl isomerase [Stellaceae bacterium]|nr:peptidylprolyl isomerase [Stellaceae bacterium]
MARRVLVAASLAVLMAMPAMAADKKAAPAKSAPAAAPAATSGGDDPVVARVNGTVIHRSELELQLRNAPQQMQQQPMDKVYPQLLTSMVNATLLEQAARKAKLDQNAQVKEQISGATTEILANAYVSSLARSEISETKLRAAYDQYAKDAPKTEEIHARHILVGTEQEAKDIIAQLDKGADFATIAKDKTTDPSGKSNGGDLGYFTKQDMVPEFANAAFALKPGEYTKTPVKTQFGWHVIKLEDRRQGKAGTYEQVAPEIAQQMTQQIIQSKLKELAGVAKIEVFGPDGKALASNAPPQAQQQQQAAPQQQQQQPVAPSLALPGGAGAGAPPPPTLSPATAPDKLGK